MIRHMTRRVIPCFLLLLSLAAPAWTAPKLVIVVSVDQYAYRYFQWFEGRFAEKGLAARVKGGGAWYANCHHGHAFTITGPGHAVLLTGAFPRQNGIIANDWYDRERDGNVYCVADGDVELIGPGSGDAPVSPKMLIGETLGDQLKQATKGKSKVFGVAIKDRAAILMTGHLADAAYWLSDNGYWVTSSYYRQDLPGYVREVNEQSGIRSYVGKSWELMFDRQHYRHGVEEDSRFENPGSGMTADFPHRMPGPGARNLVGCVTTSPFGNEATLTLARRVLVAEELGRDDWPDILAINLTSNDRVGHAFGPDSLEVEDITYRTDLQLGEFVDFVNEQLQGRHWVLYLSADHGVAPIPERAREDGLPAGRARVGGRRALQQALEAHLREALKLEEDSPPAILRLADYQIYLNAGHPQLVGPNWHAAQRIVRDWIAQHPDVAAAWTRQQLIEADDRSPSLLGAVARGFNAKRSGDVLFVLQPYRLPGGSGTTHGSPWEYDTHVPLMVLESNGGTIHPGTYTELVRPGQIAPTIARQLNVPPPSICQVDALPGTL